MLMKLRAFQCDYLGAIVLKDHPSYALVAHGCSRNVAEEMSKGTKGREGGRERERGGEREREKERHLALVNCVMSVNNSISYIFHPLHSKTKKKSENCT